MPGSFADDQRRATRQTLLVAGPVAGAVVLLAGWLLVGRGGEAGDPLDAQDLALETSTTLPGGSLVPPATLPPTEVEPTTPTAPMAVPSGTGAPIAVTTSRLPPIVTTTRPPAVAPGPGPAPRPGPTPAPGPGATTTTRAATTTTARPTALRLSGTIPFRGATGGGSCEAAEGERRTGGRYEVRSAGGVTIAEGFFDDGAGRPAGTGTGRCGWSDQDQYTLQFFVTIPVERRSRSGYRVAVGTFTTADFPDTGRSQEVVTFDENGRVVRVV